MVDVEVWEPHKINWDIIIVGLIVLGTTLLVFCIWCVIKNVRLRNEYDTLIDEIEGDGPTSASRKH